MFAKIRKIFELLMENGLSIRSSIMSYDFVNLHFTLSKTIPFNIVFLSILLLKYSTD
ncbi:MAG: hypothetical protein K0S24_4634 [Sphingobacterium sp.]|jgi:hypothetical protein|nr:hypothetical protein [Sphingobacterium sp.]